MKPGPEDKRRDCAGNPVECRSRRSGIWLSCVLFLLAGSTGRAQISPGELSKAHQSLSGSKRCTDCHNTRARPPEFRCLDCHREIAARLKAGRGLHPSMVDKTAGSRACIKCHSDHNGRNFELIRWEVPIQQFDHGKTGYQLEGRHAKLTCEQCHQPSRIQESAKKDISIKDLARTFLGLPDNCSGCHQDAHQGQLSLSCERCHDPNSWRNAPRFSHTQARFRLDATHEKVPCGKCHAPPAAAGAVTKYRGIPFEDCTPCHSDPHKSAFRAACGSCHDSVAGWKSSKASSVFRHSATRFPLLGKHAAVTCDSCHPHGNFTLPLVFAQCADCHKKDPHRGQFAARAQKGACDECHTVQGFKPSTFDAQKHRETGFPLKERHSEITCAKCHESRAEGIVYKIRDFGCVSCHRDIHESQFAIQPYSSRCDMCHTQSGFKPSTFTIARHAESRFVLAGGHAKPACEQCHKPISKPVKYRFEDRSCTMCHEDLHQGQFAERMSAVLSDGTRAGCRSCHTVDSWNDLKLFDHASTRYRLQGAHRNTACEKCHAPADKGKGIRSILYSSASQVCSDCHKDPHRGEFSMRMAILKPDGRPAGCRSCHNENGWKDLAAFDHTATNFPLAGAHKEVACQKCHPVKLPGGEAGDIRYTSTPRHCSGCHEDAHAGQFLQRPDNGDCAQCHEIIKWALSKFNHDTQSSYKLEGAHRNVACGLCHTNAREVAGKRIVIYKPTARECSACHEADTSGRQP